MDNDMKPVAYRIQWANGEVDFLTYIPKGESGVYACEPLYTHPPEPARDAKDMRAMVRRAMNAEWCYRIMADCLLMGTDYGEEMMEAALKAAMAQESGE